MTQLTVSIEDVSMLDQIKQAISLIREEKEVKAKEFWEYYETTQGTITITDPVVLD